MAELTRLIAGRPVTLRAEAAREPLANDIFLLLEELARRAPVRSGLRIRFGWSMLTLQAADDGYLVCEPDFDRNPLQDLRPQVDTTLDIAARQAATARAFGVIPTDVTFDQYVVVARGALRAQELQLYRDATESANDSGWSITPMGAGPASENPDDFEAIRVHELLRQRPEVLPLLILPVGYVALLEGAAVKAVLDPNGRECPRAQ